MASVESVINGRFKFLERPAVAPGKCAICGSVERPVLDFGLDLDFYGCVYFCVHCLREAASVAGILGDESTTQLTPPPIDYEGLNELIRAISNVADRINLVVPDYVIQFMAYQENDESEHVSNDGTIPDTQQSSDAQPEPISVPGPDDGPSTKHNEFTF